MNSCKAPRDKLRRLLQCCKLIFQSLKQGYPPDRTPGVEEFIPVFIYVILKANPPCLHSNLEYLSHFRHPSKMSAEGGYYFVSLLTAVSFLETVDSSRLSIEPADFDALMQSNTKPKFNDDISNNSNSTTVTSANAITTPTTITDANDQNNQTNNNNNSASNTSSTNTNIISNTNTTSNTNIISNSSVELEMEGSSSKNGGDWVWLSKKGNPVYLEEKKLMDLVQSPPKAASATPTPVSRPTTPVSTLITGTPSELLLKKTGSVKSITGNNNPKYHRATYKFVDKEVEELTIPDLRELLKEYKQLVAIVTAMQQ